MTPSELLALKALVVAEEARQAAEQLPGNRIADSDGALQTQETPMYSWICPNSYRHGRRWRVFFRDIQGRRKALTFATEAEAEAWRTEATKLLVSDGRPIVDVVKAYLDQLTDRKVSTLTTLRYRFQSVTKGRERLPLELFPWLAAWKERVATKSRATQIGTLVALQGLVTFAGVPKALAGVKPTGEVKAGKEQLRIDEARRFVVAALEAGDPLAVAAATMAFTGLRPGEVVALQARDVDDGGAVLWVPGTKTAAAKRQIPVDAEFQPMLLGAATGKGADALLFDFEPERRRPTKDPRKARLDALLRRVHQLCEVAGVPEVCAHSMRGLNATLRKTGGASDDSITRALGHVSIDTTRRSYFAPGIAEQADARRAHGRLLRSRAA